MAAKGALRLAYALQRWVWKVFRPRTRGVKVMLFNGQAELLLIRNQYGQSDLYVLPGGGIRLLESPQSAAEREVREELGLAVLGLTHRSRHASNAEGKRDLIHLFEGKVSGTPILDRNEVAEAIFANPRAPPPATSPATLKRIDEYMGRREADGSW
jgi:ADP-ribose pyrophosphatase YjhB (NUDIX family)